MGAEVSLIKEDLIKNLNLPILGTVSIRGIFGQPVEAKLVAMNVKPYTGPMYENIAPYLKVICAVCAITTDADVILCGSALEQLDELSAYSVLKPYSTATITVDNSTMEQVTEVSRDEIDKEAKEMTVAVDTRNSHSADKSEALPETSEVTFSSDEKNHMC